MIVYQVLTRLYSNGKLSCFSEPFFEHVRSLGVTHVWFTGIPRHATAEPFVKGNPGSPYSICDYYDINPYLSDCESDRMGEFEDLVRRTHEAGLRVIIDFVPNHVACNYADEHGDIKTFPYCDYDWTDTRKIDYSAPGTWEKMRDIVLFWASKGVDGFRCDMVELVPVEFFGWLSAHVKAEYPDVVFIGEAYELSNYRRYLHVGGFDFLYDKSGVYDILRGIRSGSRSAAELTSHWQWLSDTQPRMLNFLENHDEQRSRHWAPDGAFAELAYSALFNNASFMIYFGEEIGESAPDGHDGRTSIFEWARSIDPTSSLTEEQCAYLGRFKQVTKLASSNLCTFGRNWDLAYLQGDSFDTKKMAAFLRFDEESAILVFCNFSDQEVSLSLRLPAELCLGLEAEASAQAHSFCIVRL